MVAPNPVENALFVPRLVLNNGVVVLRGGEKKKGRGGVQVFLPTN